jgi:protein farnesyltransferase/geranylgeranyltransferase type-1 subunit alpha
VVRTFALWAEEMEYTAAMIDDDVRNNSAWNERFFCVSEGGKAEGGGGDAWRASPEGEATPRVQAEIAFVEARIALAPDNESAWNYLRGIFRRVGWNCGGHGERIARLYCGEGGGSKGARPCRHAMGVLAEVRMAAAVAVGAVGAGAAEVRGAGADRSTEAASEAAGLFASLAAIDPIRANYYAFRRAHVLGQLAPQPQAA